MTKRARSMPLPVVETFLLFLTLSGIGVDAAGPKIVANAEHMIHLTSTGGLFVWGTNNFGQVLGSGDKLSPVDVAPDFTAAGAGTIVDIAGGEHTTFAVDDSGKVFCAGVNDFGQLGITPISASVTTPTEATMLSAIDVSHIDSGRHSTFVIDTIGRLYSFGRGSDGELGHGDFSNNATPTQVAALSSKIVIQVQSGLASVIALCSDASVYSWGQNVAGQVGDGTTANRNAPFLNTGFGSGTPIQVGGTTGSHMVLTDVGELYVWGQNWNGDFGEGTLTSGRLSPGPAVPLTGITKIGTGSNHIAAFRSDGLWMWGYDNECQVGPSAATSRQATPTLVLPSSTYDLDVLSGGEYSVMAMTRGGTVYSWGGLTVGDGTTGQRCPNPPLELFVGTTPSALPSSSPSVTGTATNSATSSTTASSSASATTSETATSSASITASSSLSASTSETATSSASITASSSLSASTSETATSSASVSESPTSSETPSGTPTSSETPSGTPTSSASVSGSPTSSETPSGTPTPSETSSRSPSRTLSPSESPSSSLTPSPTSSFAPQSSPSPSPSPSPDPRPLSGRLTVVVTGVDEDLAQDEILGAVEEALEITAGANVDITEATFSKDSSALTTITLSFVIPRAGPNSKEKLEDKDEVKRAIEDALRGAGFGDSATVSVTDMTVSEESDDDNNELESWHIGVIAGGAAAVLACMSFAIGMKYRARNEVQVAGVSATPHVEMVAGSSKLEG